MSTKKVYHEPKPICEKLQYLIGVPAQYIDNYEKLNKGVMAEVRKLCNLRSTIIANFTEINEQFREGAELREIKDTARLVGDVEKYGYEINNLPSLSRNIIQLNDWIKEKMIPIAKGFKDIPEEWIMEIFCIPEGDTIDGIRGAVRRYTQFKNFYPYQKYINWPFAETPEEKRSKNIFGDDNEFKALIAEIHESKSTHLLDFIGTSEHIVVVVDCENSDAQRLYDSLMPVKSHIKKIILIDDAHTNLLWEEFINDFTNAGIFVEHDELARLKEQKSLVDLRMVAKTCEEFYKNNVKDFVFASSDSDIWALISSLPDANIFVLAEKAKCGEILIEALTQNNIKKVFMEDITTESTMLMDRAMHKSIDETLKKTCLDIKKIIYTSASKLNLFVDKEIVEKYAREVIEDAFAVKDMDELKVYLSID